MEFAPNNAANFESTTLGVEFNLRFATTSRASGDRS